MRKFRIVRAVLMVERPRARAYICGTERAGAGSRRFVRVKAMGVLDQYEEDVKMCVSGL